MDAYVLVQTDRNTEPISRALLIVPGIVSAEDVRGPYDALAVARYESGGDQLAGIVDAIHRVPGVIRALAAPLVHSPVRRPDPVAA